MHVGTFTSEGSWRAAAERLPRLADVGVSVVEVMPIADFAGRWGWGYDGVDLYAPTRLYGTPDDLRCFFNRAHELKMGVILDVVYNHLGPDGCYLREFSDIYFSERYKSEWGDSLNFDGRGCGPVREFFAANAGYWIREFHFDGLRMDATQQIFDESPKHILQEVGERVREAAGLRDTFIVAENESQDAILARSPEAGGYGLNGLWNDDFHHSAVVSLTGRNEAYYTDYFGNPQEFISALKWGYLYQGQHYHWQKQPRGTASLDLDPEQLVVYIENHDQVSNSAHGLRLHQLTGPGRLRAMTALMLLAPGTPMLFQGQEFHASAPFLFFADHNPELAKAIRAGRKEFMRQFRSLATPETAAQLADPTSEETFRRCVLDWSEWDRHDHAVALHRDLLRLRREDAVVSLQSRRGLDGAVLNGHAFCLRYFGGIGSDRLLMVNFGRDLHFSPAPEPLLAPPAGMNWEVVWSSEDPRYGGSGTPPLATDDGWRIPGEAAVFLAPAPAKEIKKPASEHSA
jgi:maltooligosyltrehalose trehalohydrolase